MDGITNYVALNALIAAGLVALAVLANPWWWIAVGALAAAVAWAVTASRRRES